MKRHISIFALLLCAFAAVGPVETAKAVDGVLFISDMPVQVEVNNTDQIDTEDSGFGDYQAEHQLYNSGTANKFKVVVPDGYRFKGWSTLEKNDDKQDGSGTSPELCSKEFSAEATIDGSLIEDKCATTARWFGYYIACPKFIKTWTITAKASPEEGGSVAIVGQEEGVTQVEVDDGGSVKLTATANEGWVFVKWSDGVTTSSRTIEQIKANATYTAEFKAKAMWNLTFEVGTDIAEIRYKIGDAETTTATNATVAVRDGTTWSATATAKRGYSDPNPQSGTATADRTITFTASPHQYTVDYDLGDGEKKSGGNYPVNENFGNSFYVSAPVSPSGRDFLGWIVVTNKDDLACAKWGTNSGNVTQDVLPDTPCANGKTGNVFFKNLTSINGDQIWLRAKWSGLTRAITVTTDPTDAGSASGGGEIEDGATATLTATPNAGYSFCCWTNGNEVVSTDNPWTFTVTADATYTAVFTGKVYKVTFITNGGTPPMSNVYEQVGTDWVWPQVSYSGHELEGWYDLATDKRIEFDAAVEPEPPQIVYAKWNEITKFTVTFADPDGGNDPIPEPRTKGQSIGEPAKGTENWKRDGYWRDNSSDWNPPLTTPVTGDMTVKAKWTSIADMLDCTNLVFNSTGNWRPCYDDLTAVNENCMRLDSSAGMANPSISTVVTNEGTMTFQWKAGKAGVKLMIRMDGNPLTNFEATAADGWMPETIVMPVEGQTSHSLAFYSDSEGLSLSWCELDNVIWTPKGAETKYTLTVTSAGNGTVDPMSTNAVKGSSVKISATPDDGYAFEKWSDGSTANPRQIVVTSNATYVATFAALPPDKYTLTVTSAGNGTVDPMSTNAVKGSSVKISATPDDGYAFEKWSDGSTENPLEVTVVSNAFYSASFTNCSYVVTFEAAGGTASMDEKVVKYGETYGGLPTAEKSDSIFIGWFLGDTEIKPETPVSTAHDHTLVAKWKQNMGEVSAALDCSNLVFAATGGGWNIYTNRDFAYSGGNDQCLRADEDDDGTGLTATIKESGTLSFYWRYKKSSRQRAASLTVSAGEGSVFFKELVAAAVISEPEWDAVSTERIEVGAGDPVILKFKCEGFDYCAIDYVAWTPDQTHPEPTDADKVTISSAAVSDGKFSLSFQSDERFDYNLRTNANLLIDSWGIMETLVGDGSMLKFEPEIIKGQPQLFYKVETIKK